MKKYITILAIIIISIPTFAQTPVVKMVGVQLPMRYDSTVNKEKLYIIKASATQDGYMPKESMKKNDSLALVVNGNFVYFDNLTKAQAAQITALQSKVTSLETRMAAAEAKLNSYGTRITQNEINIQQLGTQVDINKLKIQGIIVEIDKFLVALRNIL